ncbi:MAG: MATE family efflux transporter [Spirochaetales bacterium]|nr:MATE family efflux transporter [Spirochaetales bacterium]
MRSASSDLTCGSLGQHMINLAIPASTGFFFNTMYNVVDTFWAGRLSTDSLAALSLNFPLYLLVMSLGVGFTSAAGSLIANALGAGEKEQAKKYHSQSLTLTVILTFIAAGILSNLLEPLFQLLNSEGEVLSGAVAYGRIIVLGMPLMNLTPVAGAGLTARGDTKTFRNALMGGFLLNIGLDPFFIYVLDMKEAGVALATVIIQCFTLFYMISRLNRTKGLSGLRIKDFIPQKKWAWEILGQSLPASANYLTMALGTFVITWFIAAFGSYPVAAYGAAVRLEQIALVLASGLNTALAAMAGQNNGAGKMDRVRDTFKLSLKGGALVMIIAFPLILIFGKFLLGLFTETAEVIEMGYDYLLFQGITFYSYILLFQSNSLLQGLKKPAMIMYMGIYRQVLAPAVIFSLFCFGLGLEEKGVWIGLIPINWSAALITLFWTRKMFRLRREECAPQNSLP